MRSNLNMPKERKCKKPALIDSISNLPFFCTGREVLLAKYVNLEVAEAKRVKLIPRKAVFSIFFLLGEQVFVPIFKPS